MVPMAVRSGGDGRKTLVGTLNGGGPLVTLHANGGQVSIQPFNPGERDGPAIMSSHERRLYAELTARLRHLQVLESVGEHLGWDEQVNLPEGAAAQRGEQMEALAAAAHELARRFPALGEVPRDIDRLPLPDGAGLERGTRRASGRPRLPEGFRPRHQAARGIRAGEGRAVQPGLPCVGRGPAGLEFRRLCPGGRRRTSTWLGARLPTSAWAPPLTTVFSISTIRA